MRAGLTRKEPGIIRVTQAPRRVEAPPKPNPKPGWFQRFLDALGCRTVIEDLEMENCRLMLQFQVTVQP